MAHDHARSRLDRACRDRYGTDMPTLMREVDRLSYALRTRERELRHKAKEVQELEHANRRLAAKFYSLRDQYEDLRRRFGRGRRHRS